MTKYQDNSAEPSRVEMEIEDLLMRGLLWKINHEILHPLGISLCLNLETKQLDLRVARDRVWTFPDDINMTKAAQFRGWVREVLREASLIEQRSGHPSDDGERQADVVRLDSRRRST